MREGGWEDRVRSGGVGGGPDDRDDSRHYAAVWADQTREVQRGGEVVLGVMFWEKFLCCLDGPKVYFVFQQSIVFQPRWSLSL